MRECNAKDGETIEVKTMKADRYRFVLGGLLSIVSMLHSGACRAQQTPAAGIAAQIRAQGYRCDDPVSADRDAEQSRPNEAVWILKCQNSTYRVRLIPDMAARVEQL
jgi:hypothetical protein